MRFTTTSLIVLLAVGTSPANVPTSNNTTKSELPAFLLSSETTSEDQALYTGDVLARKLGLPIPPDYRRWELPRHSKKKWRVYSYVSLFIRQILEVDEKNEELVVDADFGLQWVDWKIYEFLKKSSTTENGDIIFEHRTLDSEVLKYIWKPDVFIDEISSVQRTSIISQVNTIQFKGGKDGGDIIYTSRVTLKLRCDMSFEYYPADIQTCEYIVRSYEYNATRFVVFWNVVENARGIYLNDPTDPNFDVMVESAIPEDPDGDARFYVEEKFDDFRRGNYSALKFTLKIRRKLSYHLVQTYLPSVLLIAITWLCFLLPGDMVEARIGISMTTLLTLTAMFSTVREQSPGVSYTMAIDIFMVFCIFSVFLALLLFAVLHWLERHLTGAKDEQVAIKYRKAMVWAKRYAFLFFAAVFIIFLVTYWSWLLLSSEHFNWDPKPELNGAIEDGEVSEETNLYKTHEADYDEYAKGADEVKEETTVTDMLGEDETTESILLNVTISDKE